MSIENIPWASGKKNEKLGQAVEKKAQKEKIVGADSANLLDDGVLEGPLEWKSPKLGADEHYILSQQMEEKLQGLTEKTQKLKDQRNQDFKEYRSLLDEHEEEYDEYAKRNRERYDRNTELLSLRDALVKKEEPLTQRADRLYEFQEGTLDWYDVFTPEQVSDKMVEYGGLSHLMMGLGSAASLLRKISFGKVNVHPDQAFARKCAHIMAQEEMVLLNKEVSQIRKEIDKIQAENDGLIEKDRESKEFLKTPEGEPLSKIIDFQNKIPNIDKRLEKIQGDLN